MRYFSGSSSRQADSTWPKTRYATGHVDCSFLPAACALARILDRPAAGGVAGGARQRSQGRPWLVIGFAAAHAVLWTVILINLKAAQDVHMDVAEGFAWGQKFQLGYGKHPPLAGWIAGRLVQDVSGHRLGHLRAGDDDARLRTGDLAG